MNMKSPKARVVDLEPIDPVKGEKFRDHAAKRVNKILGFYENLTKMATSSSYEWSRPDAAKMLTVLRKGLDELEAAYKPRAGGQAKDEFTF